MIWWRKKVETETKIDIEAVELEKVKLRKEVLKLDEEIKQLRKRAIFKSTFWIPFITTTGIIITFFLAWSNNLIDFKKIENRAESLIVKMEIERFEGKRDSLDRENRRLVTENGQLATSIAYLKSEQICLEEERNLFFKSNKRLIAQRNKFREIAQLLVNDLDGFFQANKDCPCLQDREITADQTNIYASDTISINGLDNAFRRLKVTFENSFNETFDTTFVR